jgi:methionyl-tRNA formyltransferase
MIKTSSPIVFFGSGPVAEKSLEFLSTRFSIEAVITKPIQTNSRDKVPVMNLAKKLNLNIFTPRNKIELDELISKNEFSAQLGVLIDYGIIVSQRVIDNFRLGILNSHFSLLPVLRGPDPISFAILNGLDISGVSLMLIDSGIDEGKLIAQEQLKIEGLTNIELTDQLISLSNTMLEKSIPKYISGELVPYAQSTKIKPTFSRKLSKQDGIINWNKSADTIEREIRAYILWPKSSTDIFGVSVIITKAVVSKIEGKAGKIDYDKNSMNIKCSTGSLDIINLKPAGRNEMTISSFISGYVN